MYLFLASGWHIAATLTVFLAGRFGLFPSAFDRNGIGSFAFDGSSYLADAANLAGLLRHGEIATWWRAVFPLHTKLFSLSFAVLAPVVGFNIVAAEPVNLLSYIAVLVLVFKIGAEIFDRRAGFVAACIVGAWPTFLLHTTQILKDPLFIAVFLGLTLMNARCFARSLTWKQSLRASGSGGLLLILLWLIRPDLWELSLLVVVLALIFLMLRLLREKKILKQNVVAAVLIFAFAISIPLLVKRYRNPDPHPFLTVTRSGSGQQIGIAGASGTPPAVNPPSRSSSSLTRLRERIAWARYLYVNYPARGSNIDADVHLESWGEIVRYLPRATVIGLFAPFPRTWFASGTQVGRGGRLLGGIETLLMYCAYALVLITLWHRRGDLTVWYLTAVAALSVIALSIVTANVGALYRLRYPFWILLFVLASDVVSRAFPYRRVEFNL